MILVPARVQLNRPLPPLTYLAPEGLPAGVRVRVKVRNSVAVGLAMGMDPAPPAARLRPIEAVLDPFPLLPAKLRELQAFAARYYGCLEAQLLPLSLPQALLAQWEADEDGQRLSFHRDRGAWDVLADLGEAWHRDPSILPTLLHRTALRGSGFTEVRLTGAPHPPRVTPAQAKILLALEEAGGALMELELLESAGVGASVLGTLEKRGLVARMKRVDLLAQRREAGTDRTVVLSEEQSAALEAVTLGAFGVHLLQGVTGSGKTEVYLALAERVLAAGRRVLWLVPEIGLTARLLDRLEARFPGRVAVGHAGLNVGEKHGDVVRLLFNGADLFVGVRNAVMAPLRDIGLIIVDEEHEGSYKSEEHPRIHARDLAIKRAQLEACPIVLGSATPSLESWQAAKVGRYRLIQLRQRPVGVTLPKVEIVDLRDTYRLLRRKVILSPTLQQALTDTLAKGEQALLLLNRRGYENFWMCRACGKTLGCPHCAISLTYHRGDYRLRCHLCGHETVPPEACPDCGADHLRGVGEGTEQVEEHLTQLFPSARILRLDRDTTRRRGSLEAGLLAAEAGQVDILVGTQMLAKGHTFPGLTLVGVLNADQGLKVADFRASERTFQLLTQVAGRAGRAERSGRVILQTYSPEHPAISFALAQDFEGFAASELPFREGLGYPPFTALSLYRAEADSLSEARQALEGFRQRLSVPGLRVLGPLEAPVPRIRDRWRMHLLLKGTRGALSEVLARQPLDPAGAVSLDRDPIQFG
ncbi:primosomal protein N' [Geothrix sp. PMB-07]|uniref:replication restart helicase PriA n=1 Tax=Geothrix sp. PMB-07 TaxID=3068640 RepID=UPI002740A201|nr:primosomal protein N' [Geothrix sp. PMB-07]WLT32905.1 primosomal protein N' [Geothrix sp. PMB-07]